MKILYLIPARGGSKGIPFKNIKLLGGRPLICHTIDVAREMTSDENICVSTDDDKVIEVVENYGLKVPFKRPDSLATDTASTNDVLLHAISFYEKEGRHFDILVLLQPTSPFRKVNHIKEALSNFTNNIDMIVSVRESHSASVICEENEKGYLESLFNKSGLRRQDSNHYYEYNGAIYIINIEKLKSVPLHKLTKKKKYVMDELSSIDIDSNIDWIIAESILSGINS